MSQGAESNNSGKFLESFVESEARARKFLIIDFNDDQNNTDLFSPQRLVKNVPFTSIYGCRSRGEFRLISDFLGREVRVECRYQHTAGSTDEKFPYLLMNAIHAMPEREVVFLVEGEGARKSAIEWLRRRCQECETKRLYLFTRVHEYRQWFQKFASGEA